MAYSLLIVCPEEFHRVSEMYAQFKRRCGIDCLVVPFELGRTRARLSGLPFLKELKIDPQYLDEPASCLKIDLTRYYLGTKTRYVLLAGDADKIPVPWFEFVQDGSRFFYPTDLYYADLFSRKLWSRGNWQSWDPDADSVKGEFRPTEISAIDFVPDLAVGRIPASSAAELETAFSRLMHRQARPLRFVFLRGNDPNLTPWLEQVSKEAADRLERRGYSVNRFSIEPNADSAAAATVLSKVHQKLQEGVEYIFWFGHGSKWAWQNFGPHQLIFSQEVPNISGSPMVFSMSCEVGFYTEGVYGVSVYFSNGVLVSAQSSSTPPVPDSLQPPPSGLGVDFGPEEWLVRHPAGASALIAGHSWGSLGSDYLKLQPLDFIDGIFAAERSSPPPMLGTVFNSTILKFLGRYKARPAHDPVALNHLLRLHLFGDPTMPLFR